MNEADNIKKTITNEYLGTSIEIEGKSPLEIKLKEQKVIEHWAEQEEQQKEREEIDNLRDIAEFDTAHIKKLIQECQSILEKNLEADRKMKWVDLYKDEPYPPFVFKAPVPRFEKISKEMGVPKKHFFAELFLPRVKRKRMILEKEAKQAYQSQLTHYEEEKRKAQAAHEKQRSQYSKEQQEHNVFVDKLQLDFEMGRPAAVENFIRIVLLTLITPFAVTAEYEIHYLKDEKLVIINADLPGLYDIPGISRYVYNEVEHGVTAIKMGQQEFDDLYQSILLQLSLSAVNLVFHSVDVRFVDVVGFNGWVRTADDELTEEEKRGCIVSCKTNRDIFEAVDLTGKPPKKSFLALNGVLFEPLTALKPVQPLVNFKSPPVRPVQAPETKTGLQPVDYKPGDFKDLKKEITSIILEQVEESLTNMNQKKADLH